MTVFSDDHAKIARDEADLAERKRKLGLEKDDAPTVIEDKVWRAYGLLRFAQSISVEEVMNLLSGVRLGEGLKLIPDLRVYTLNQIMIFAQSAHLEKLAGSPLSAGDADVYRASYVRRLLEGETPDAAGSQA